MRTRLQGYVTGCPGQIGFGTSDGFDFGVWLTEPGMKTSPDDLTVSNKNATDHRIRFDEPFPALGKFQRLPHQIVIGHVREGHNIYINCVTPICKGGYHMMATSFFKTDAPLV
jgi:hypothetical protein